MASGSISLTSTKAWRGKISLKSTADTAGNYSDLYVYATMWKTDGYITSSNNYTSGTITIDGESYNLIGYQEFKDEVCIFEDTVRIYHDSDGSKSISISLSCEGQPNTSLSGYTLSGNGTLVLDTIARSANLSVDSGILGAEQTINIVSDSDELTYTITYSCGSKSGTICTKSNSKSIKWTPPLTLAEENTTGGSVSVKLSLTTYSGITSVGTNSESIQCEIPESVKPSFTAEFTDAAGYKDDYGTFIQLLSKLHTVVTAASLYGATIKAYKITANGETFTTAECTTGVLTSSGDITVQISVTDSRDRTTQNEFKLNVAVYTLPVVSYLSVRRCDIDGNENDQGEYVKVTFSASAYSFDSKNTVSYTLEYKKSTEYGYTVVNLSEYNDVFAITGETYIFAADTGSSYDVRITVKDSFSVVSKSTTASTAATIMHFKANGKGIGLGKVAERDNTVDVGWDMCMNSHRINEVGDPEEDGDATNKKYVDAIKEIVDGFQETFDTWQEKVNEKISNMYPVGSIYISVTSTDPKEIFGGEWDRIEDRFLLAAGEQFAPGTHGGEAEHTLTIDEIPEHTHGGVRRNRAGDSGSVSTGASSDSSDTTSYTDPAGNSQPHNNMPPYIAVYIWQRTA